MEKRESKGGYAAEAAKSLLVRKGYEVLDGFEGGDAFCIVALDEGELAFVFVRQVEGRFESVLDRIGCESAAAWWLAKGESPVEDCDVRFDDLQVQLVAKDKAFVRHHVDALGVMG